MIAIKLSMLLHAGRRWRKRRRKKSRNRSMNIGPAEELGLFHFMTIF